MSRITDIESRIRQLSPEELTAFREWFVEFDNETWDRQLEADIAAGRLDALADEALAEARRGENTDL